MDPVMKRPTTTKMKMMMTNDDNDNNNEDELIQSIKYCTGCML